MRRERFWIASAAVVAAVAAFPLAQTGQASAQQTKTGLPAIMPAEQAPSQVLNRDGQVVRVVYPSPITAR
jgi:hypothetical protein